MASTLLREDRTGETFSAANPASFESAIKTTLEIEDADFSNWMTSIRIRTEDALDVRLAAPSVVPGRLHQAMRYAALGGGKRVRPLLCHAAGAVVGAAPQALDAAAAALEMIHVYSLVHDDMPAMDNDALRRGKPTVHVRYDEATAMLVGDALQSQAFTTLSEAPLPPPQRIALVRELAQAAGSLGMAGGQAIDLMSVGINLSRIELEQMHRMKTGAMFLAAVRMGALCGVGPDQGGGHLLHKALDDYAQAIGLAFQVVDDILDVTSDAATLGKTAGKDQQVGKPTYVSLLGLPAARALAQQLHDNGRTALEPLGKRARLLGKLADLVIERVY